MEEKLFDELPGNYEGVGGQTPDGKRLGYNRNHEIQDGLRIYRRMV
jgi:hypothetical protein